MESEEDIERSAAFDEELRSRSFASSHGDIDSRRMQTIRLLHEVFRAEPLPSAASDGSETFMPENVGRFRILRQLGSGGFGTVYLAKDPLLNRLVALKLIHSHLLRDPLVRSRALREREAMARLQHPNIIPVWEAGEVNNQLYIVSEYCQGQTLALYLTLHPQAIAGSVAAQWVYRLADAIAHSHERGVIHRDLKPGNILLDPRAPHSQSEEDDLRFEPRLGDFGLAKILDCPSPDSASGKRTPPTQSGLFVGSLEYASPEQVKGDPTAVGTASDVYALGVLLFQLLTGRLPHMAESQYDLARRICEEDVRFPSAQIRSVPRDLQAITLRAMARDTSDRYPSAAALRDDIGRYLKGVPVLARPVSAVEHAIRFARRRPAVTILASTCCLLALMYLYILVISPLRPYQQSQALQAALKHAHEQRTEAELQRLRAEEGQKSLSKLVYRDSIKLAFDQWQQQNYIGLHDTLQRLDRNHPSTMELQYLDQQLRSAYLKFDLQLEPVQALAWHQNNQYIITISASGRLRRWSPDLPNALSEHPTANGAHSLAIHPDGKTLALPQLLNANAKTSNITFWNEADASPQTEKLQSHSTTVESLEYSPNGRWLAAGPRYSNVIVTDLENQDSFAIKSNRRNRQVVFSPESDRLAVYEAIGKIEIYDLNSRKTVATILNHLDSELASFYSLAWVPGRDVIIANGRHEQLLVYSARDGQRLAEVSAGMQAENIAVSPDGRRVVLGDSVGFVRFFDLSAILAGTTDKSVTADSVALTPKLRVLNGKITDVAFIDANCIVAADEEGNMMRLRLPKPQPTLTFDGSYRQMHWQDDEHLWLYGYDGTSVRYLKASHDGWEALTEIPTHVDREVARAKNATHAAMAAMDGRITVVNTKTGSQISTCQLPTGKAPALAYPVADRLLFSADGQTLFATGENNRVTAMRLADGEIMWTKEFTNAGYCLAEDTARGRLYLGGAFEALKILDTASGQQQAEYVGGNGTMASVFNSQLQQLFSGHDDGTVRQHFLKSGEPPTIHPVSTSGISAISMTPDYRTMITGDETGALRLADEEVVPYGTLYRSTMPSAQVAALNWSPSGRKLAALIFSTEVSRSEVVLFESGLPNDGK